MVAAALGHSSETRIASIPFSGDGTESAYAIYDGDELSKLIVLNMQAFNQTGNSDSDARPSRSYAFEVPGHHQRAKIERLTAPGSDAKDQITFAGVSYDYHLKEGKPVVVGPEHEMVDVEDGVVSVGVPDSSAVLMTLV